MVTDADGRFLSQRTHAALGRYRLDIEGEMLVLQAEGAPGCRVPLRPEGEADARVEIWGDPVEARSVSEAADAFFSSLLGVPAHLVYMPEQSRRPVPGYDGMAVSFADAYPILVTTTASLEDLNGRIEGPPLPMLAFRPNVVVETQTPWAEDTWERVSGSHVVFECTTTCERCRIATLDPAAPDRPRPDGEPLRTLATFRRNEDGKVTFGRNAVVRSAGDLRLGEALGAPGLVTAPSR